jgi:hypothetical protein
MQMSPATNDASAFSPTTAQAASQAPPRPPRLAAPSIADSESAHGGGVFETVDAYHPGLLSSLLPRGAASTASPSAGPAGQQQVPRSGSRVAQEPAAKAQGDGQGDAAALLAHAHSHVLLTWPQSCAPRTIMVRRDIEVCPATCQGGVKIVSSSGHSVTAALAAAPLSTNARRRASGMVLLNA